MEEPVGRFSSVANQALSEDRSSSSNDPDQALSGIPKKDHSNNDHMSTIHHKLPGKGDSMNGDDDNDAENSTQSSATPRYARATDRSSTGAFQQHEINDVMRYVSFLDPDTIRWMNARRPLNASAIPGHVLPSLALQLKEMFNSLDFDNSGGIDISELKIAVNFVSDNIKPSEKTVTETKEIVKFFESMDKDGNGVVDFVEFLAQVTSQQHMNAAMVADKATRLQAAFLEFANQLRRQKIDERLASNDTSISNKFQELKNLYSINYFIEEDGLRSDMADPQAAFEKQKKEMNVALGAGRRRKELERARDAASALRATRNGETYTSLNHSKRRPQSAAAAMDKFDKEMDLAMLDIPHYTPTLPSLTMHVTSNSNSSHSNSGNANCNLNLVGHSSNVSSHSKGGKIVASPSSARSTVAAIQITSPASYHTRAASNASSNAASNAVSPPSINSPTAGSYSPPTGNLNPINLEKYNFHHLPLVKESATEEVGVEGDSTKSSSNTCNTTPSSSHKGLELLSASAPSLSSFNNNKSSPSSGLFSNLSGMIKSTEASPSSISALPAILSSSSASPMYQPVHRQRARPGVMQTLPEEETSAAPGPLTRGLSRQRSGLGTLGRQQSNRRVTFHS